MQLNRYIDHTLLVPSAMDAAFNDLLEAAVKYNFYAVCVPPHVAERAVRGLKDYPDTKVCSVVAFPHGNVPLDWKLSQAQYLIERGVQEIDWVINVADVFEEDWHTLEEEMDKMADLCRSGGVVSKCIVETGAVISPRLIKEMFLLVRGSKVDFIKTSTGFNGEGAQLEHIQMWHALRGGHTYPKIKASGGIKDPEKAVALIKAGADRLGMSASADVFEKWQKSQA